MKKKIMTLMMGTLLLLTACGQTRDSSASGLLPVAAVQSAAQAITPVEEKAQEDTVNLPAEETVEEAKDVGDEETPNPTEGAKMPSAKTEETPSAPTGEEQPNVPEQPTSPEQPEMPAPAPTLAEKPEQTVPEVAPAPAPVASGDIYSIAEAIRRLQQRWEDMPTGAYPGTTFENLRRIYHEERNDTGQDRPDHPRQ